MMRLDNILNNFYKKRVVVVGDVMLDEYVNGKVERISSEAPIPIIDITNGSYHPGGAANVAANIATLGGKVSLFGFIGADEAGRSLKKILREGNVKYYLGKNSKTTLKKRIAPQGHQLIRLDHEDKTLKKFNKNLLHSMENQILDSDIIVISDYSKGTISEDLINFLKSTNKIIIADPKTRNIAPYKDIFLIKINEKEAYDISYEKDIYESGRNLKKFFNSNLLITRGKKGMVLFSDKEFEIPTYADEEVYDVSGAGDTVIAALALSLTSGASLEEAAVISNYAAGISVTKIGTYQVKIDELRKIIYRNNNK